MSHRHPLHLDTVRHSGFSRSFADRLCPIVAYCKQCIEELFVMGTRVLLATPLHTSEHHYREATEYT